MDMEELRQYREQIDRIDREIARLFQDRMEVVCAVAQYKQARGLPVLDAQREKQVLAAKVQLARDQEMAADLTDLFEHIMAIARRRQHRLIRDEER